MKKLALVLGALLLAATASAKEVVAAPVEVQEIVVEEAVVAVPEAPKFRAISVGQELEYETRNTDEENTPTLYNTVKLGYGDDWTFTVQAVKEWKIKDQDHGTSESDSSAQSRLAFRKGFTFDNDATYGVGLRWRGYEDYNKYYLAQDYSYKALSGWVDVAYEDKENGATFADGTTLADSIYSEAEPIKVAIGPMTLSYYYEGETYEGNDAYYFEQQVRLGFPIYKGEKLTLDGEYRLGLSKESEDNGGNTQYGVGNDYDFGQKNVLYFYPSYAVNENLTVGGYLGLEAGSWNGSGKDGDSNKEDKDSYYCDYGLTWEYKF